MGIGSKGNSFLSATPLSNASVAGSMVWLKHEELVRITFDCSSRDWRDRASAGEIAKENTFVAETIFLNGDH
jgi:hypothetical protein